MPTYIHVVYCGAGDAFILEYTANGRRQMVLLDGGPTVDVAESSRPVPFWLYYMGTMQEVWKDMRTNDPNLPIRIKPDAIIATHLDEDHYGGLKKVLETSSPAHMDFDGPFLFPAKSKTGDKTLINLRKLLRDNKNAQRLSEYRQFSVPGLELNFPTPQEVACFKRLPPPVPAPPTPKPAGNVEDFNETSLLINTNITAPGEEATMYLTGDSYAKRIRDSISAHYGQNNTPVFSIYKIQHHGSRRSCNNIDYPASGGSGRNTLLQSTVAEEIIVRLMFTRFLEGVVDLEEAVLIPAEMGDAAGRWIYNRLVTILGSPSAIELAGYLEILKQRYNELLNLLMHDQDKQIFGLEDCKTKYPDGWKTAKELLKALKTAVYSIALDSAEEQLFFKPHPPFYQWRNDNARARKNRTKLEWYEEFWTMRNWQKLLDLVGDIPSIEKFFLSFNAKAYLVSANFKKALSSFRFHFDRTCACKTSPSWW